MADKRLLQVFISYNGGNNGPKIFEVNSDSEKNLICSCPGFESKNTCKHVALIESRIAKNNGVYQFDFSKKITQEELREAMKTEKSFRDLIIKYAKVEVY